MKEFIDVNITGEFAKKIIILVKISTTQTNEIFIFMSSVVEGGFVAQAYTTDECSGEKYCEYRDIPNQTVR